MAINVSIAQSSFKQRLANLFIYSDGQFQSQPTFFEGTKVQSVQIFYISRTLNLALNLGVF